MADLLADWVMLSEIEHWAYCARQWAIIHLEQHFADNDDTVRGSLAHERVDRAGGERRHDLQTVWSLPVRSDSHRLFGRCDRVEIRAGGVVPVEYKSGRRAFRAAEAQLAGQALCLEEMFHTSVAVGELYLVATNETRTVEINEARRTDALQIADAIRAARRAWNRMPPAHNDERCPSCSLNDACLPAIVAAPSRVRGLHGATWWP